MKKRKHKEQLHTQIERRLQENFWLPENGVNFQADFEEFNRRFGLRPELAVFLGLRQFLREDTLNAQH